MDKRYIVSVSLSFITGAIIAYHIAPETAFSVCIAVAAIVAALIARKNKVAMLVCISVLAMALGMVRVTVTGNHTENALANLYQKHVSIKGVITSDIEEKGSYSRYIVTIQTVDGKPQKKKSAVVVYEPYPTSCTVGNSVTVEGKIKEPKDFLNDAGRVVKYKQHLRQRGIHASITTRKVTCDERGKITPFASIRKHLVDAMHASLPAQEAALLGGLVLGIRGAMSSEILEAFRITGLIHIIVLSGYNITLIAESIRRLFASAKKWLAFTLSATTIVGFVLLAGAQTAAVRAGGMAVIALIARSANREYDGIRVLAFVALAMTIYNPDQVLFSTSFHLSFLATTGLLLFTPIFEKMFTSIPEKFEIRSIVSATVATQVFLLPYLAYAIGEVSIIGIPANILILPIIPVAMVLGSAVTLVALVSKTVAMIVSPFALLPLKTITFIAEHLSRTPNATMQLPEITMPMVIFATALLALIGCEYTETQRIKQHNSKQGRRFAQNKHDRNKNQKR